MMRLLLLMPLIILNACGQYSIRNLDNPTPRPNYGGWIKPDGSPMQYLEAKRALLECGDPSPEASGFEYEMALGITDEEEQIKHSFMVQGCMESSGLRQTWSSLKKDCSLQDRYATFPACQPGAVFPKRSVERRLNSWYCKIHTDREYCRKHTFIPSACDDPKEDYNNPPLECLP
ncbi:MAG: hypothetical protein EG825_14325 [Rhodocyclaceae bacterium]|nr:hypothetical protein [Rhodocyclaceae bacterium]